MQGVKADQQFYDKNSRYDIIGYHTEIVFKSESPVLPYGFQDQQQDRNQDQSSYGNVGVLVVDKSF